MRWKQLSTSYWQPKSWTPPPPSSFIEEADWPHKKLRPAWQKLRMKTWRSKSRSPKRVRLLITPSKRQTSQGRATGAARTPRVWQSHEQLSFGNGSAERLQVQHCAGMCRSAEPAARERVCDRQRQVRRHRSRDGRGNWRGGWVWVRVCTLAPFGEIEPRSSS